MIFYREPSYSLGNVSLYNTSYYFIGLSISKLRQSSRNIRNFTSKIEASINQTTESVSLLFQIPLESLFPSQNWFFTLFINKEEVTHAVRWNHRELQTKIFEIYKDTYHEIISQKMSQSGNTDSTDSILDVGPVILIEDSQSCGLEILKGSRTYTEIISKIAQEWSSQTVNLIDFLSTQSSLFNNQLYITYKNTIYYGQEFYGCLTMSLPGINIKTKKYYEIETDSEEFNGLSERFMTKFHIENKTSLEEATALLSNLKLNLHKANCQYQESLFPFKDHRSILSRHFRIDLKRFSDDNETLKPGVLPPKIFQLNSIDILITDINILDTSDINDDKAKENYEDYGSPILVATNVEDYPYIDYSTKRFMTCNRFYKIYKSYSEDIQQINHPEVVDPIKNYSKTTIKARPSVYKGGIYTDKPMTNNELEVYRLSTPRDIKTFQEKIYNNIKVLTNFYTNNKSQTVLRAINRSYKIWWYIKSMAELVNIIGAQEGVIIESAMFNNHIPTAQRLSAYQAAKRMEEGLSGVQTSIQDLSTRLSQQDFAVMLSFVKSKLSASSLSEEQVNNILISTQQFYQNFYYLSDGVAKLPSPPKVQELSSSKESPSVKTTIKQPFGTKAYSTTRVVEDNINPETSVSSPVDIERGYSLAAYIEPKLFITPIKYYMKQDSVNDSGVKNKNGQTSGTFHGLLRSLNSEKQQILSNIKTLYIDQQDRSVEIFTLRTQLIEIDSQIECLTNISTLSNINKNWENNSDDFLQKFNGDELQDVFLEEDQAQLKNTWEDECKKLIPTLNIPNSKEKYTAFNKFNLKEHSTLFLEKTMFIGYEYKKFSITFMFTVNELSSKERIAINCVVNFDPTPLISTFIKLIPLPPVENVGNLYWPIV